jgi:cytoplasmic iron level regulating protein YaaA (DUF328/UPF0246 family)
MRQTSSGSKPLHEPELLDKATKLANYLKTLPITELARVMHLSDNLAEKTQQLLGGWTTKLDLQMTAVDSFLGDIYSGLQASSWSANDRAYADEHLRILSGLYGMLRPLDSIRPYRLELGYKLPAQPYANLYDYWADSVADCLPSSGTIINLASLEYSKLVLPFIEEKRVITPTFLTVQRNSSTPTFVAVHTKIARGAFAHWLVSKRIEDDHGLASFSDIGYSFDKTRSTPGLPVYTCNEFGGKGLSIRLQ